MSTIYVEFWPIFCAIFIKRQESKIQLCHPEGKVSKCLFQNIRGRDNPVVIIVIRWTSIHAKRHHEPQNLRIMGVCKHQLWESDWMAFKRSAVRSRLSPPKHLEIVRFRGASCWCARWAHVLKGESPESARQREGYSLSQGCLSWGRIWRKAAAKLWPDEQKSHIRPLARASFPE